MAVFLAACSGSTEIAAPGSGPNSLTVFAAASLTHALTEMAAGFEAENPGLHVRLNFGGSNALRLQIEAGAQADVFASANQDEMLALLSGGLVATGADKILLSNELVIVLAPGNPGAVQSLADLARPGLKLVLASPEVPAGRYARRLLEGLEALYGTEFVKSTLANAVSYEENVRLVLTKVELGVADAGIVYLSDAASAPSLPRLEIPSGYNVIARYWIAPLQAAPSPDRAAAFVAYALSPEGQAVLAKWGFAPPGP